MASAIRGQLRVSCADVIKDRVGAVAQPRAPSDRDAVRFTDDEAP
jgi:hypothetical protein